METTANPEESSVNAQEYESEYSPSSVQIEGSENGVETLTQIFSDQVPEIERKDSVMDIEEAALGSEPVINLENQEPHHELEFSAGSTVAAVSSPTFRREGDDEYVLEF
jgi:hypothetical protein